MTGLKKLCKAGFYYCSNTEKLAANCPFFLHNIVELQSAISPATPTGSAVPARPLRARRIG
ncbi:MAG: hypothetical protein AAGF58_08770, partial [Pseudomonadota bacterium]